MDMKLSELKKQIKDNIYEILSEEPVTENFGPAVQSTDPKAREIEDKINKDPKIAKQIAQIMAQAEKGGDTTKLLSQMTGLFESDDEDQEPSKAELEKKDSITTASNKLQKLVTKMKELAKEYTEAKGDKKEKIKDELKKLTADKKALEKIILPSSEED